MADKAADAQVLLNSERKYRSYSYEDRLNVIMLSDGGMSSIEIKAMTGIDDGLVRYWIRRYRKYGLDGLKRKRYAAPIVPSAFNADSPAKGFIRYVDNPEILASQVEKLRRNGLENDSIIISMSPDSVFNEMAGSTVVVNSLYDLASDLTGIVRLVTVALKKKITLVSLSDGKFQISSQSDNMTGVFEVLGKYAYSNNHIMKIDTKVKNNYTGIRTSQAMLEAECDIMAGSQTDVMLEVDNVSVEEYTPGFDEDGNDFKTISFD